MKQTEKITKEVYFIVNEIGKFLSVKPSIGYFFSDNKEYAVRYSDLSRAIQLAQEKRLKISEQIS